MGNGSGTAGNLFAPVGDWRGLDKSKDEQRCVPLTRAVVGAPAADAKSIIYEMFYWYYSLVLGAFIPIIHIIRMRRIFFFAVFVS